MATRDAVSFLSDGNILFYSNPAFIYHVICFLVLYKVKVYKMKLLWFKKLSWLVSRDIFYIKTIDVMRLSLSVQWAKGEYKTSL